MDWSSSADALWRMQAGETMGGNWLNERLRPSYTPSRYFSFENRMFGIFEAAKISEP
jgi:hypothetical protein